MTMAETLTPASDPVAILKGFSSLQRLTAMYPRSHPMIRQKLDELNGIVTAHLTTHDDLRLEVIHDNVFLNGITYSADAAPDFQVLRRLSEMGIDSIHIASGVSIEELATVAEVLRDLDAVGASTPLGGELARRDVRHITFGKLVPLDTHAPAQQWPDAPTGPLDPDYAESLLLAERAFQQAAERQLDPVTVRDLIHLLMYQVARSSVAIAHVLAIKHYENLTYCHSVNVAILTLLLAKQVGLDEQTTLGLVEAGVLHDLGKTRIPLDVLKKPGALDKRERRIMESHTVLGAEMLAQMDGLRPLTATIALEHHRGVDGGGYPDLGAGVVPHAASQLVAVADVYEALTGARSYQDPLPPERACLVLARLAGTKLNTSLVKAFVNAITFFPIGSFVRTSRGETGIVVRANSSDPLHPVLAVLSAGVNGPFEYVDTSRRTDDGCPCEIVETLPPPQEDFDMKRFLTN
jgi:putative nucleotidyltransferase with HDIG domain